MEQQGKIKGSGFSPSFSFYSSDTSTSTAAAKVIREEQQAARFHKFGDLDEDDFEFSLELSEEEVSAEDIDSRGWTVFPVFNRDLLVKNSDDVKSKDNEVHSSDFNTDSIIRPLRKLFIDEREESSSSSSSSSCSSSSEADELEAGTYCVWRPKAEGENLPIKKSSSILPDLDLRSGISGICSGGATVKERNLSSCC